jgi:hypothetical protein
MFRGIKTVSHGYSFSGYTDLAPSFRVLDPAGKKRLKMERDRV